MKGYIKERTLQVASHIENTEDTIRKTAQIFNLSKSTVHNDLSKRLKKYDAKMLSISDVVQPETTMTVYEYIRQNLVNQMQTMYLQNAANEIAKSLNTPENVEYKKTGDALIKLLSWGE